MLKSKWLLMCASLLSLLSLKAQAQFYGNMYGSGMTMAAGMCPYQQKLDVGDAAEQVLADIKEQKERLKDLTKELSEDKKALNTAKSELRKSKTEFGRTGYKESSKVTELVKRHLESKYSCDSYQETPAPQCEKPAPAADRGGNETEFNLAIIAADNTWQKCLSKKIKNVKAKEASNVKCTDEYNAARERAGRLRPAPVAQDPVCSQKPTPPVASSAPFKPADMRNLCNNGELSTGICTQAGADAGERGYKYDSSACGQALTAWQKNDKELKAAQEKVDAKNLEIKALNKLIAELSKDAKNAIKDHLEEVKDNGGTEGGICIECMLAGNGAMYKSPTTAETLGQVALGIGSMYFGKQLQSQQANYNAQLGFATQPVPTIGYGFPYFMGALYGAIGGGGGSGAGSGGSFGCGGGMNGGGYQTGPQGMMGPFIGGGYGPQGGAMGYPAGMYPTPAGGGMFMPGMGNWGVNGPGGLDMGMGGMGMGNAMLNPYGMGQGNGMGYGNPYASMGMGYGNPMMGAYNPMAMMGQGNGMGGYNPYGNMSGMPGMGMGNGMGGYNPYANMGMGNGMGGYNPYGMGNGMGMGNYGLGMMNPYGNMGNTMGTNNMQNYMVQQQMQMQQAQAYAQQQQRAQQNYIAGTQVISSLASQMQQIQQQISQVQISMQTGGSVGYYMGPQNTGTNFYSGGVNTGYNGYNTGGTVQPYMPGAGVNQTTTGTAPVR